MQYPYSTLAAALKKAMPLTASESTLCNYIATLTVAGRERLATVLAPVLADLAPGEGYAYFRWRSNNRLHGFWFRDWFNLQDRNKYWQDF